MKIKLKIVYNVPCTSVCAMLSGHCFTMLYVASLQKEIAKIQRREQKLRSLPFNSVSTLKRYEITIKSLDWPKESGISPFWIMTSNFQAVQRQSEILIFCMIKRYGHFF